MVIRTLESLKRINRIFCNKGALKFHGDKSYDLYVEDGVQYLKIKMEEGRVAVYKVGADGYLRHQHD